MASEKSNVEIIKIKKVVDEVFGTHLHHKQSESLGYAALALLNSESLIYPINFKMLTIKSNTTIITKKEALKAGSRLEKGRIVTLKNVGVTLQNYKVSTFVATQDKGMKAPWYLVSNIVGPGSKLIQHYSKRWKIEPYFRDLKDGRFGYGLEQTHYRTAQRRDRLMLIVVLCYRLLVILGQAGEQIGFDKKLKVNTVKKRTHSLFNQGQFYYKFYPRFTTEEQRQLTSQFSDLLQQETFWKQLFETATLEGTG